MKSKKKRIEEFVRSIDYRDICYFIEHVKNISFRKSLLEELGYRIGIEFPKTNNQLYNVYIGKKNDLRMFITDKFKDVNLAYSIILENY